MRPTCKGLLILFIENVQFKEMSQDSWLKESVAEVLLRMQSVEHAVSILRPAAKILGNFRTTAELVFRGFDSWIENM